MPLISTYQVTTLDRTIYVIQASSVAHAASRATVHLITQPTKSALIVVARLVPQGRDIDIPDFDASAHIEQIRSHYWGLQGARAPTVTATDRKVEGAI